MLRTIRLEMHRTDRAETLRTISPEMHRTDKAVRTTARIMAARTAARIMVARTTATRRISSSTDEKGRFAPLFDCEKECVTIEKDCDIVTGSVILSERECKF